MNTKGIFQNQQDKGYFRSKNSELKTFHLATGARKEFLLKYEKDLAGSSRAVPSTKLG